MIYIIGRNSRIYRVGHVHWQKSYENLEKNTKNISNFLKIRILLDKNILILRKLFSVFFLEFSHDFCQCTGLNEMQKLFSIFFQL